MSTEIATTDDARLMALAIEQGEAGVAALERLVALRERAEAQAAKQEFARALAQFQRDCPPIRKTQRGAHGAAYEDLDGIMAVIGPTLAENWLSVTYDTEKGETPDTINVLCYVRHAGGHVEHAGFPIRKEAPSSRMNACQADGSALTYGKRYALGLALGITTGERDDDGAGSRDLEPVTEEQAANLRALAEEVGADVDKFLNWAGCDTFAGVPAGKYPAAVKLLERKRKA